MISALAEFDAPTAVGILARAAFAVEDDGNPAAVARLPNEEGIRSSLFAEVRRQIGVGPDDWSPETVGRIGDALDEELERLSPVPNPDQILEKLGKKGELPPDLYNISLNPQIGELYQKHRWAELERIEKTVKEPDRDESVGLELGTGREPGLVKIFARHYPGSNPFHDFTHLVIAQPAEDRKLNITAAWRLYTFSVPHPPQASLLEMLRQFCSVYGSPFRVNGVLHDALSLQLELPGPELHVNVEIGPTFAFDSKGRRREKPLDPHTVVWFTERGESVEGSRYALMVMVINTRKYMAALEQHGW